MRRIRKCAELLVKLKIAIHRAHKINLDGSGKPICWELVNWRKAQIKKEDKNTPSILVKKEESPTPCLLYPGTNEPSRYTSLDPNNFDWGSDAMVD